MDHRVMLRVTALFAALGGAAGCQHDADVWLQGRVLSASTEGIADDAAPFTPAVHYDTSDRELWANDSLTSAYSEPPRAGRLAGGVDAEPVDTALGSSVGYATARSLNRVVFPLEVREAGRVQLEIALRLADVEISGAGVPRVDVTGTIQDSAGQPVPGGDIGTLSLEIRPDGAVLLDQFPDERDALQPNGRYSRTLSGPTGGVMLRPGRYRVAMELAIEATAPTASGPYQLARIGQATATLRVP